MIEHLKESVSLNKYITVTTVIDILSPTDSTKASIKPVLIYGIMLHERSVNFTNLTLRSNFNQSGSMKWVQDHPLSVCYALPTSDCPIFSIFSFSNFKKIIMF